MDFIFDPSLVLYLPLYELDGASFISKDVYAHLSVATGALWTPGGRDFDGVDDSVNCGKASPLDLTGALTIIVWIKIPAAAAVDKYLLAKHNGTTVQYFIIIDADAKVVAGTTAGALTSNIALSRDTWHHIAYGRDSDSNGFIDLNGEVNKTSSLGAPTSVNVDLTFPGRYGTPVLFPLQCQIGEVYIYNRALTPLERQRNYLATKRRYV